MHSWPSRYVCSQSVTISIMNLAVASLSILSISLILSVESTTEVIRVETKHYEPFMYQNAIGQFENGIEFQLLKTIANKLNMKLVFSESKLDLETMNTT